MKGNQFFCLVWIILAANESPGVSTENTAWFLLDMAVAAYFFYRAMKADELIDECLERLVPILTHKRPVRRMRIPVDYEHDDDVFILTRLREVKARLRMDDSSLLSKAIAKSCDKAAGKLVEEIDNEF